MKTTTLTLTKGGNILITTSLFGRNICAGRSAKVKEYFDVDSVFSYKIKAVKNGIAYYSIRTKIGMYDVAFTKNSIDLSLLPFTDYHKAELLTAILFSEPYILISGILEVM